MRGWESGGVRSHSLLLAFCSCLVSFVAPCRMLAALCLGVGGWECWREGDMVRGLRWAGRSPWSRMGLTCCERPADLGEA